MVLYLVFEHVDQVIVITAIIIINIVMDLIIGQYSTIIISFIITNIVIVSNV